MEGEVATAQEHYEHLLAQHYTWMFGKPFNHLVAEQAALLRDAGVRTPGRCIDLGTGAGFQAMALADLGATHVHAIDTSMALLQELRSVAGNRPITTHEADLIAFDTLIDEPVDTIVCMGDTLTHLPNRDEVSGLFSMLAANLSAGGRCVISWRDLSSPPQGVDRFIPVRSDDDRVMVCFLEDHGEIVLVNDLVHVRTSDGWTLHKSAYPKLKLSRDWIRGALQDAELAVDFERTDRGMTVLSAVAR